MKIVDKRVNTNRHGELQDLRQKILILRSSQSSADTVFFLVQVGRSIQLQHGVEGLLVPCSQYGLVAGAPEVGVEVRAQADVLVETSLGFFGHLFVVQPCQSAQDKSSQ